MAWSEAALLLGAYTTKRISDFAEELGVSNSRISEQLSGRARMGKRLADAIYASCDAHDAARIIQASEKAYHERRKVT